MRLCFEIRLSLISGKLKSLLTQPRKALEKTWNKYKMLGLLVSFDCQSGTNFQVNKSYEFVQQFLG